jgi:hypothetical protein
MMRFLDALTRHPLRRCLIVPVALIAAAGFGACSEAESRDAPETDAPASTQAEAETEANAPARHTVPEGTSMTFRIDETISTETHAAGDRFTATLHTNINDVEGAQVISEGTASQWLVSESTTTDGQALLAVQLESIRVNGAWVPLVATVTEASIDSDQAATGGETAAKIGVGAAAGALIGQILGGDTRSTLTGAGVGAAVGAVVALTTRGGSATLPAGSAVVVQLSEPLVIS